MNCGIVGSRKFPNQSAVTNFVVKVVDAGWHVVSGGADGPDTWAADAYEEYTGAKATVHRPSWYQADGTYSPRAALNRNTVIVNDSDMLAAFWDGVSTGTRDSIRKAVEKKIPTFVFDQTGTITEVYLNGEKLL